ncbi:MAG: tRNA (guanosine(46)-N7)-methyltransferase TrmB [Spirochaetes bacterium]|nr:tRNA (guanosine(46)-N7)-methyltransferase TrmB [Spirochaetota bacterium]MBU0956287.1 tRNA (guanosine(46)-N7)-methyltransferase TrmB [Spirochaetota bacterium]
MENSSTLIQHQCECVAPEADIDPLHTCLSSGGSELRSYVLRNGRMTETQKRALLDGYPLFGLVYKPGRLIQPEQLFGRKGPFIVEIGFGMGDASADIATNLPDHNILGLEVHAPGVGHLLDLVMQHKLQNLRVCRHDAMDVIETMLAPDSVDGFLIFFPDPWPKKRHHKRRLIRPSILSLLTSRLKPGGYIYFASDWEEYAESALEMFLAEPGLQNQFARWAERREWRPVTKFEQRAITEGRPIREIYFVKKSSNQE